MTEQTYSPNQMYDFFLEPIVLVRAGAVAYLNPAAAKLFPKANPGDIPQTLIEALGGLPGVPAVLEARVAEVDWAIRLQEAVSGYLMVFTRVPLVHTTFPLGGCAHQLRSRTDGLLAILQRSFSDHTYSEEKRQQYGALACAAGYRILHQADEMEFLARDDLYRPAAMDLAGLCREVALALEGVCKTTHWRFTYESKLENLITTGDDLILRRMLMALLTNAIKAAGTEHDFGMRLVQREDRAVITVWDCGPGTTIETLMELHDDEPTRLSLDPSKGAGTGGRTVAWAVKLHEGTVLTCARRGGGVQAIVSLPIRLPERGLPVETGWDPYTSDQFSPLLIELADVLPLSFYSPGAETKW